MMTFNVVRRADKPFPHTECVDVFQSDIYRALLAAWPDERLFQPLGGVYKKLALSERCNPNEYRDVVASHPWDAVRQYFKTQFIPAAASAAGFSLGGGRWSARFEFSSLPTNGGMIFPHRDIPSKVLTVIVPITHVAVPGWGTDILEPFRPVGDDYQTPRDAFRAVSSFEYAPNTCGIFLKTENSWHSIGPLAGGPMPWRRTLTINVERL